MKRLWILLLLPPPFFAMQPAQKEYYEDVMGSLILVKETQTTAGIEVNGTFRKGGSIIYTKDGQGNARAEFVTKKGEIIDSAIFSADEPEAIYEALKKKECFEKVTLDQTLQK